MKKSKIKTYVLIVSRYFPSYHPKTGQETGFVQKIKNLLQQEWELANLGEVRTKHVETKIHTIRGNYELWKKRIEEVQYGQAIISLRYWAGQPYNKDEHGVGQVEFARLDRHSGVGVQKLERNTHLFNDIWTWIIDNKGFHGTTDKAKKVVAAEKLAQNDGLSVQDFKDWFAPYDMSKPMAIIHWAHYRY